MKVLVAPSAYKGTFSPVQLAGAITAGIRSGGEIAIGSTIEAGFESITDTDTIDVIACPIADGGDGTLECLHHSAGGDLHEATVSGPLSERVHAHWLQLGSTAVVELAQICGLALLKDQVLEPLAAHTTGLGEMVVEACNAGMADVILAVGGSASTDGGAGMLTGCGARFLDRDGGRLTPGGDSLRLLDRCELSHLYTLCERRRFRVAADVTNPLLGQTGAAAIYGPQKGASPDQVRMLDEALGHYADVLEAATGRQRRDVAGAGAAGGTAFGAMCGLDAKLVAGFDLLAEVIRLEEKVAACDLVITAEGAMDKQSLMGKATGGLIAMCRRYGKKLLAVPAVAEDIDWKSLGIALVMPTGLPDRPATLTDVSATVRRAFGSSFMKL